MEAKEKKVLDLAELDQVDTAFIDLVHPSTGDDLGIKVEIYGQDSEKYRTEQRKAEAKFGEYSRRHHGKFMPPEEREKMDRAKIAACTKSISIVHKGQTLTDADAIYQLFPWIYEQVCSGIIDRGNFIKGSSTK